MTSFPSEITMNQSLALSHIFLFAAVVIYRIYDSRTVQPTVRNPGVAIPIRISAHNNRRQASFKDHPADIGFRYIFSVNISIPLFHEIDSFVSFGTTSASPIIGAARAADQSDQPFVFNILGTYSSFVQGPGSVPIKVGPPVGPKCPISVIGPPMPPPPVPPVPMPPSAAWRPFAGEIPTHRPLRPARE